MEEAYDGGIEWSQSAAPKIGFYVVALAVI